MGNKVPKILVVEDDTAIASSIADRLAYEGWNAVVVGDGETAVNIFQSEDPDAVVLDVMLPKLDGFGVVSHLRSISTVPILILTARNNPDDEVELLGLGADDFLEKPLRPSILVAHLKVWLKRYQHIKETIGRDDINDIKIGDFLIDQKRFEVTVTDHETANSITPELTPTEFSLLIMFSADPEKAFPRKIILQRVWGWSDDDGTRTVDSHIKGLRRKIGAKYIQTVHGVGYRFLPTGVAKVVDSQAEARSKNPFI